MWKSIYSFLWSKISYGSTWMKKTVQGSLTKIARIEFLKNIWNNMGDTWKITLVILSKVVNKVTNQNCRSTLLTNASHIEFDQCINNRLRYRPAWKVHLSTQEKKSLYRSKMVKTWENSGRVKLRPLILNVMKFDYKFIPYSREGSHTIMSKRNNNPITGLDRPWGF